MIETTVKNYNGLPTDTKPTIAGGADVLNGSRFRELHENGKVKIYHFSLADDKWYLSDEYIETIANANPVVDLRMLAVLENCELLLKKIECHLSLASDADLTTL